MAFCIQASATVRATANSEMGVVSSTPVSQGRIQAGLASTSKAALSTASEGINMMVNWGALAQLLGIVTADELINV